MTERSGGVTVAQCLGTAAAVAVASAWLLHWWHTRRRSGENQEVPDISIPEALHTLAHGPPESRVLASRALTGVLSGEAQVLEEVLDEASGQHPEFGGKRADGRSILGVVLDDLNAGVASGTRKGQIDAEFLIDFLLQCTDWDSEWDETDEWNSMVLRAVAMLRNDEGAEAHLAEAEAQLPNIQVDGPSPCSATAAKIAVLRRRLGGEREVQAADPREEPGVSPGMLSMNTRVQCSVCNVMRPDFVRCPRCRNVGYCTGEHLKEDALRHSAWCFELHSCKDSDKAYVESTVS